MSLIGKLTNMKALIILCIISVLSHKGYGLTPTESQLSQLLSETAGQPFKRAEMLKQFVKSNADMSIAIDATLLEGIALLKIEQAGPHAEALLLFKDVMKQGRKTWREAMATVAMANALHVAGEHEAVLALATYAIENGVLAKLDLAENEMPEVVKKELQFEAGFYRDLMFEMLALAHKNLKQPDEAGRVFSQITHPRIRVSYPNGIGTPTPEKPSTSNEVETSTKQKRFESGPRSPSNQIDNTLRNARSSEVPENTQSKPLTSSDEPTSFSLWSVFAAMAIAAAGVLWLRLKRIREKQPRG